MQTINQTEEVVEIPVAEYEAIKAFSIVISEQNAVNQEQAAAVLESVGTLRAEMVAMAENYTATMASLVDAIRSIQIIVNVPEQPTPVVNMPAPKVTIQEAADKPQKVNLKVKRDKNGAVSSIEGTSE